jgi:hypothetical protein
MDKLGVVASNRFMARCNSCFGILTKTDLACYVCGETAPGAEPTRAWSLLLRAWAKIAEPSANSITVGDRIRGLNHSNGETEAVHRGLK